MAKIKETVDGLPKEKILYEEPEKPVKPAPAEPTAEQIEQVVERLAQPWLYGKFVARIERDLGIAHSVVMEIKEKFDERKALEQASAVAEKEILEVK